MKKKGIREQIAVSTSPTEIGTLVHTALELRYASPKTIRRIHRTATARLAALKRDGIGQTPNRAERRDTTFRVHGTETGRYRHTVLAAALILGGIR